MPTRPDACCPRQPTHKQIEVAFSDPDDRTHHWRCTTPVLAEGSAPASGTYGVQMCGAEWVTPWRDDTFTDEYLRGIVAKFTESLNAARRALADALQELATAATCDADAEWPVPIAGWEPRYPARVRKVERYFRSVEVAEEDVRVWKVQQQMQLSRRDTASPASSQHYIDTGNYCDLGWETRTEATT